MDSSGLQVPQVTLGSGTSFYLEVGPLCEQSGYTPLDLYY